MPQTGDCVPRHSAAVCRKSEEEVPLSEAWSAAREDTHVQVPYPAGLHHLPSNERDDPSVRLCSPESSSPGLLTWEVSRACEGSHCRCPQGRPGLPADRAAR